jgi:hypothetical protein
MTELSHVEAIQQRAYAIWEEAGRPVGQDREHWLQAEAEISTAPPNGARPTRAKAARSATPARRTRRAN